MVARPSGAGLPPGARRLLDAIAGLESGDRYNVRFDGSPTGALFDDYSAHPRVFEPIPEGFKAAGEKSSAAGRYQITATTWDRVAPRVGAEDFSPRNQDRAAWALAVDDYRRNTGRDLLTDLEAGETGRIRRGLSGTWEALGGMSDEDFAAALQETRMADASPYMLRRAQSVAEQPEGAASDYMLRRARAAAGIKEPEPETPQPESQSFAAGVLDKVTDGMMLGYGSRLTALEGAAIQGLSELVGGQDDGRTFWEDYERRRTAEDAQNDAFAAAYPITSTISEIGGAVLPALGSGGATLAGRGAASALKFTPAGVASVAAQGGRTATGQVVRGAAAGAGAGAVYGSSEGEGLVDRGLNALTGAGTGAAGGAAGAQLARWLTRAIANPNLFANGKLTPAAREQLKANGIDPDQISDDFVNAFAARVRQASGQSDETVRMATADEFGIPLTRGQATGDVAESAFEEAARNAGRGPLAGAAVRSMDDSASRRVTEAVDATVERLGGQSDDALAAAERAGEAVARRGREVKAAADAAYDALAETGASVPGQAAAMLPRALRSAVENGDGIVIDAATPNASSALAMIGRRFQGAERGGVTFARIEDTRQQINRMWRAAQSGSIGADATAMTTLKRAYDEWVEGLFERGMMEGDTGIIETAKTARGAWASWKRTFFAGSPTDDAGKLIERLVRNDATPKEVSDMLWGVSAVGERGASVRLAARLKDILPEAAWNEVRAGAFLKAAEAPAGKSFGFDKMASRLESFLGTGDKTGAGQALAEVLYTPAEIARMRRFARALRILTPPREATNPSRTGYAVARIGQDMFRAFMGAAGLAGGGPVGGLGGVIAASLPGAARDAARAATLPAVRPFVREIRPALPIAGGAGAAVVGTQGVPTNTQ